jgi:TolB protein
MRFMVPLVAIFLGHAGTPPQDAQAWKPGAADLLFSSTRNGNSEVYLLRAGQSEWVNLSNHKGGDNWPVWSPDGERVAFQSNRAGNLDIWSMKADGTEQVQLTKDPEPDYIPSWSPDGKTILFTSWRKEKDDENRAPHVYLMNADGSNQRRLVKESLNTSDGATWSPGGEMIVYSRKGKKGADVYVASNDGTNERRITNDQEKNVYNGSATFSPDGKSIAFYSDNEKSAALMVIGVDGKNRRTLVSEGHNWYPRWSPDGRWLVYTAIAPGDDKKNIDIFAVSVAGDAKPILLVGGPKREVEGSWRPEPLSRRAKPALHLAASHHEEPNPSFNPNPTVTISHHHRSVRPTVGPTNVGR